MTGQSGDYDQKFLYSALKLYKSQNSNRFHWAEIVGELLEILILSLVLSRDLLTEFGGCWQCKNKQIEIWSVRWYLLPRTAAQSHYYLQNSYQTFLPICHLDNQLEEIGQTDTAELLSPPPLSRPWSGSGRAGAGRSCCPDWQSLVWVLSLPPPLGTGVRPNRVLEISFSATSHI